MPTSNRCSSPSPTTRVIDDAETIAAITEEFAKIPYLYIADGHHRSAAAALVGNEKARMNPAHRGDEEYNYFLAVAFPASHLKIIDYNRVVRDLNGMSPAEFLEKLEKNFVVEDKGEATYTPVALHNFALYLEGHWYSLTAREGTYDDNDPIGQLDVTISSDLILRDLIGITDLRSDKRIDFVGGIRGLEELRRRVDSGEMAFAHKHRRHWQHHASEDHLVRTQAAFGTGDTFSGLTAYTLQGRGRSVARGFVVCAPT